MLKRLAVPLFLVTLFCVGSAVAQQQQQQYPMLDKLAQKIIDKYSSSSCGELAQAKTQKPTGERAEMEQRAIQMLKSDPQMRQYFINKVAAPIANKMFECGMIP